MENLPGVVQEFFFFDSEIVEATATARMKQGFSEKFSVRRV